MDSRLLATIIIFPIWLLLTIVFRKHRQWLLYYMTGAFGLTILLVFLVELTGLDQLVVNTASFHVNFIAQKYLHMNVELLTNGRFQVFMPDGGSSILKLGIECSAVLESSILFGLIAFYPLFSIDQKVLRITFGLMMTYVLNIARLMIILLMAYKYGPDYIFVAHAFVARAFFFIFELMLYWWLMTKPSVKAVGDSLNLKMPLSRAAKIGISLKRSHSMGQLIFIAFVLAFSAYTYIVSPETSKIFAGLTPEKRPIIYQEETDVQVGNDSEIKVDKNFQAVAGASKAEASESSKLIFEMPLILGGGEKSVWEFVIGQEGLLDVQIPQGKGDLAARILVNGHEVDFTTSTSWRYTKQKSIFAPIKVKPGDVLKVKFQNLEDGPSELLISIYLSERPNE